MRGPQPEFKVEMSSRQHKFLHRQLRSRQVSRGRAVRIRIVELARQGLSNTEIAWRTDTAVVTVRLWRRWWCEAQPRLDEAEVAGATQRELSAMLLAVFDDAPRPGAPVKFTPEQLTHVFAIACEDPAESGRPISQWTGRELADELVKRGIVKAISGRHVSRLLDEADLQPHRTRYWLTPPDDPDLDAKIKAICEVYRTAPERAQAGERTLSTDEMCGIQAVERVAPDLPMKAGRVRRIEFKYDRHGTQTLIANFDVVVGRVVSPTCGETRTEADFAHHIERTLASDPATTRWHFVLDQLNTHMSETLVRFVAQRDQLKLDLGKKGKRGILKSMQSRAAFLSDPTHSVVFHYTPKHSSWLNQIEIWFSILVRKLLRRASFTSQADLKARVLAFIDYFNRTMAKPFKWTYSGKVLAA